MSALIIAWVAAAWAAPVVVSGEISPDKAGDIEEAIGESADVVPWASLRSGLPRLRSGERVEVCGGTASESLEKVMGELQSALNYLELEKASDLGTRAVQAALCAPSPPPPPTLARLELLLGVSASQREDDPTPHFRASRALDPDLPWITDFGVEPPAAFSEPSAAPDIDVGWVPGPLDAWTVDGGPASTSVNPGRHWAARKGAGLVVFDVSSPDELVWPAAFTSWMPDPRDRAQAAALSNLMSVSLGEGEVAYVLHDGELYRGTTGNPVLRPLEADEIRKPFRWPRALLLGSVAVAGAGGVWTGISYSSAQRAVIGMEESNNSDAFLRADADWADATRQVRTSRWVAAGGGLALAVSIPLDQIWWPRRRQ